MQFLSDKLNQTNSILDSLDPKPKLISNEVFHKAIYANVIIATVVGCLGTLANILIIVTFFRQGFKDTVNVSLTSLAVVDMASLICLTWMSTCYNPSFHRLVARKFNSLQFAYVFGALPRSHLMLIGSWITAVVASERCVCVIRPLEVKYILTKSRLAIVLGIIFIASLVPTVPLYYSTRIMVYYDANWNTTRMGIAFTDDRPTIDLQFSGISVAIFVSAFVIVTVSTAVIIWTLVSQSKWRASMMAQPQSHQPPKQQTADTTNTNTTTEARIDNKCQGKSDKQNHYSNKNKDGGKKNTSTGLSQRDRKAAQTVSLIAAMFVVCYFPGILNLLAEAFIPGFKMGGRFSNAYQFFWSVSHTTEAICSSANIFVYIRNSTNFRTTLKALFKFKS